MKLKQLNVWVSILLVLCIAGCAGSRGKKTDPAVTMLQIEGKVKPLTHKFAATLLDKPAGRFGSQMADDFFGSLVEAIRGNGRLIDLVAPQDRAFPEFMQVDLGGDAKPDVFDMAEQARVQGFQGFVTVTFSQVQTKKEKTGILWFRTTDYYLIYSVTISAYDAFTASKLLELVREKSFKVNQMDYESYRTNSQLAIDGLNESVMDLARDLGKDVAGVLRKQPWQAIVSTVQGDRVFFDTGGISGLKIGDVLMIFKRRRTVDGREGARFILTGPEIGKARVDVVQGEFAEAVIEEGGGIQEGDLLVAVH